MKVFLIAFASLFIGMGTLCAEDYNVKITWSYSGQKYKEEANSSWRTESYGPWRFWDTFLNRKSSKPEYPMSFNGFLWEKTVSDTGISEDVPGLGIELDYVRFESPYLYSRQSERQNGDRIFDHVYRRAFTVIDDYSADKNFHVGLSFGPNNTLDFDLNADLYGPIFAQLETYHAYKDNLHMHEEGIETTYDLVYPKLNIRTGTHGRIPLERGTDRQLHIGYKKVTFERTVLDTDYLSGNAEPYYLYDNTTKYYIELKHTAGFDPETLLPTGVTEVLSITTFNGAPLTESWVYDEDIAGIEFNELLNYYYECTTAHDHPFITDDDIRDPYEPYYSRQASGGEFEMINFDYQFHDVKIEVR